MNGLVLFLCSLMALTPSAREGLWQYHAQRFEQYREARDFPRALRELGHLSSLNEKRYAEELWLLRLAELAERHGYLETAWRAYHDAPVEPNLKVMDELRCLQKMGRHAAVLDLAASGAKLSRADRWDLKAAQAEAFLALGREGDAERIYQDLTARKTPMRYRLDAYYQLASLYYRLEDHRRARRFAEALQGNWPGSDEALYAVTLQEQAEDEAFLKRTSVWKRFAWVCYRNRAYQRSDHYFQKIADHADSLKERDRARYFLALTHTKREKPAVAAKVFQTALPELKTEFYKGLATFQYARTLLMNGQDREVVELVQSTSGKMKRDRWLRESMRLEILALRRLGDWSEFRTLAKRMKAVGANASLFDFYHRNGVIWSMQRHDPGRALYYLNKYRRPRMKLQQRQEANLWEGMIRWEEGDSDKAIQLWLEVANADPNHYFGLVARELLASNRHLYTDYFRQWARFEKEEKPSRELLQRLYYLAPDRNHRKRVASSLIEHLPALENRFTIDALSEAHPARRWAAVGQFAWAAKSLEAKHTSRETFHFLKASWHGLAGNAYRSISHGEILAKHYPRWVPHELLPQSIQQLVYPIAFGDIIESQASRQDVDPYLLLAIIREESRFNQFAKSGASARGLMQFIPSTAQSIAGELEDLQHFSLAHLYEPETAIALGARYVNNLMSNFEGKSLFTVAAYNAGEGAVNRWRTFSGETNPVHFVWDVTYEETKNYCQKVLRAYHHYKRVYENESAIQVPELTAR
ncbi:Transglycosylase SLT domain-containing protein [Sulfidibacter corallicola]